MAPIVRKQKRGKARVESVKSWTSGLLGARPSRAKPLAEANLMDTTACQSQVGRKVQNPAYEHHAHAHGSESDSSTLNPSRAAWKWRPEYKPAKPSKLIKPVNNRTPDPFITRVKSMHDEHDLLECLPTPPALTRRFPTSRRSSLSTSPGSTP